jgi:hypothetical protein
MAATGQASQLIHRKRGLRERKLPDSPAGLDNHDAALGEVAFERWEVGEQHLRLPIGSSLCPRLLGLSTGRNELCSQVGGFQQL